MEPIPTAVASFVGDDAAAFESIDLRVVSFCTVGKILFICRLLFETDSNSSSSYTSELSPIRELLLRSPIDFEFETLKPEVSLLSESSILVF